MAIGHGQLGLSDRLRTFKDLVSDPSNSRRPYLDLELGKPLEGGGNWVVHAGSIQKTTITAASITYMGVVRAIVGVESMITPRPLTRVERIADIVAGTWYYDDSALVAGGSTDLYVQLPDSSDPDSTTVVLLLLFTFAVQGEVHPILGPQKQPNATLDSWSSSTDCDNWTETNVAATGVAINRESADVFEGVFAATITPGASGLAASSGGGLVATGLTTVAGAAYLVSVAYETAPALNIDLSARIRVELGVGAGEYVLVDGVNSGTGATNSLGLALRNTAGEWRRAVFIFRCPSDLTTLQIALFLTNAGVGAVTGGYVRFDDFHFHRIWRHSYYAGNLSDGSIPELDIAQSMLFGPRSLGIGGISILDGDGSLTRTMAALLKIQKPAAVYVGGAFTSGEELTRDDWRIAFPAVTRRPDYSDGTVALELEDALALSRVKAAQSTYRIASLANMDPNAEGRAKPLLFGETAEYIIKATRVDVNGNGYGYYEFLDPTIPIADAVSVVLPSGYAITAYPNEESANVNKRGYEISTPITSSSVANPTTITTSRRHGLTTGDNVVISGHAGSTPVLAGSYVATVVTDTTFTIPVNVTVGGTGGKLVSDFSLSNQNTRWQVLKDIRNYQYDHAGNDVGTNASFAFQLTGTIYFANINVVGPAWKVAADLQAAMRAASGSGTITVTYSESTHKFTAAKGATGINFQLLVTTVNSPTIDAHKESWKLLGFDTQADKTGATSYTGENPTFGSPEADHVLRFSGGGYNDDAAGSICGVASASLNTPAAMASWLLQKICKVPPAQIDVASFKTARQGNIDDFGFIFSYLDKGGDAYGELAWLSQVGIMVLAQGTDGIWRCRKYATGTTGARSFFDRDYLDWRMWEEPAAIFKEVRVYGAYHPARAEFRKYGDAAAVIGTGIPVKYGSEGIFELYGFLDEPFITGGTQKISNYYGRLVTKVPRCVEFAATGKLVDLTLGDKVILTRTGPGVLDTTGALAAVAFRVIGLRHNYLTGVSQCTAIEDVVFLS